MVGPDSVVSSAGAAAGDDDMQLRQHADDDEEEEKTTTTITRTGAALSDVSDVDIVQLLTRRLSVSPPTDVVLNVQRRQMTPYRPSIEVPICLLLSVCLSHSLSLFSLLFRAVFPFLFSSCRSLVAIEHCNNIYIYI